MVRRNTKRALLDAATKLFSAKGFSAVGVREIAETAGVNLGMIQYHFGSKARLFTASVHDIMSSGDSIRAAEVLHDVPDDLESSARAIGLFISRVLSKFLRPTGIQHCRLIYREVFCDSTGASKRMFEDLVSAVAEDFARPLENDLCAILSRLAPERDDDELRLISRSLFGQCVYYLSNRPFLERLEGADLGESPHFERICRHVTSFSLRGLGCDEALVKVGLEAIPAPVGVEA